MGLHSLIRVLYRNKFGEIAVILVNPPHILDLKMSIYIYIGRESNLIKLLLDRNRFEVFQIKFWSSKVHFFKKVFSFFNILVSFFCKIISRK